jgi:hypothetical protein
MTPADWQRAHEYTQECWRRDEAESTRKAVRAAQDRERDERVARALLADADRAELAEITRAVKAGSAEGLRLHVNYLLRHHRISVTWRTWTACANWSRRHVTIPPVTSAFYYATGLHELGHVLEGRCPGTAPHQISISDEYMTCVACEVNAWERAMRIAIIWTREMHQNMQEALPTYRCRPAPPAMKTAIVRTSSNLRRAELQQARLAREDREARQRRYLESMR